MSDTIFKQVSYTIESLVNEISLGVIGLPDLQRPFVWKNTKVRDLFDSIYKGYPIGYLLFWKSAGEINAKVIGSDNKQKAASLLIVDGQQRLTSLYAVLKGVKVVTEDYVEERIQIAFDPLNEVFEVADAAIRRDKSYIPNISIVWDPKTNIFDFVDNFLTELKKTRHVSAEEENKIQKSFFKLMQIKSFPLIALELSSELSEEKVADVFVRINSMGAKLNQADFILTLMSVFWDEGRTELETFSRNAKQPSLSGSSPFNHHIKPSPDQLLRVTVGLAFKRARLQHIYSILRGKDLETEQFSEEKRDSQFGLLKEAQANVLNLNYWHGFFQAVTMAGYLRETMIGSQINLLYNYILYLIGRIEYKIPEIELRKVISQWYFMTSITSRYTGSSESAMEADLKRLENVHTGEEFIRLFQRICATVLTQDFWKITLPNALANSSTKSPSLLAYNASLVINDANVLFSDMKVRTLLDPTIKSTRSGVERHHLFPKAYLKRIGYSKTSEINQIANYAYVEPPVNLKISDKAPKEYLQEVPNIKIEKLNKMIQHHALPLHWEDLSYEQFLQERRELISEQIFRAYQKLTPESSDSHIESLEQDVYTMVNTGETNSIEFKATLRTNLHTNQRDPKMEFSVVRTIAGFLNTSSGTLTIGVFDDGTANGIDVDGFENEDKMALHLINLIKSKLGPTIPTLINMHFEDFEGHRVLVVRVRKSLKPVYYSDNNTKRFFIRTGPSTTELDVSQVNSYINLNF